MALIDPSLLYQAALTQEIEYDERLDDILMRIAEARCQVRISSPSVRDSSQN